MIQTNHFYNLGYGWLCKHCSAEDAEREHHHPHHQHQSKPFALPLASWSDPGHHILACPRCGIQELISN